MDEYITPGELLLLVALYGGPAYLVGAVLAWVSVPMGARRGTSHVTRSAIVLLVALLAALVLTVVFWWLLGQLPSRVRRWLPEPEFLGIGAPIVLPALLASVVTFSIAAWLLRRHAVPSGYAPA